MTVAVAGALLLLSWAVVGRLIWRSFDRAGMLDRTGRAIAGLWPIVVVLLAVWLAIWVALSLFGAACFGAAFLAGIARDRWENLF